MPASSPERDKANRDEILSAAQRLYKERDFRDISLNDIASLTTLSRPSIYNYFQSKEEIFLGLLKREYELWSSDIRGIDSPANDVTAYARALAKSLERRELLLRLMTSNLADIESNSSMNALVEFKKVFGASMDAVREATRKCMPSMKQEGLERFVLSFFPFVYGIYPYAIVTDKQREAMKKAGLDFSYRTIYEVALPGIEDLLLAGTK